MSFAEFEEKEFEGPLNGQLGMGAPIWTPGQVLEQIVGIDAAMVVHDALFWADRGYPVVPSGAVMLPGWYPTALSRLAVRFRRPPPFRLNVFLQYKRPERLDGARAGEWSLWQKAYYRFAITAHQQRALNACASALGSDGLVAYASPAFHSRVDLWTHVEQRTLVKNTHFAPASQLSGHGRYTYIDATSPGLAHSEPVVVEPLTVLNGGGGDDPLDPPPVGGGERSPEELLSDARRAAEAAVRASPYLVGTEALFLAAVQRVVSLLDRLRADEVQAALDFVYVATFSRMSRIRWSIMY